LNADRLYLLESSLLDTAIGGDSFVQSPFNFTAGTGSYLSIAGPLVSALGYFQTASSTYECQTPSSILDVGGGISYAFCQLFVPSYAVTDQFLHLNDYLFTKIPFSYVGSINDAFGNITLDATSSFPLISIPLSTVASSTITGVMPDITFGTSTIGRYYSDSIRVPLNLLLTGAIWLAAGWKAWAIAIALFP